MNDNLKYTFAILTLILLSCETRNLKHLDTALDFYDNGDYLNALVYFSKVDSTYYPCEHLPLKAVCFREWNGHKEAIAILESCRKSCESALDTYINLSDSYHKLEQYDSAIAVVKQGLQLFPRDPILYYNLGVSYYKINLYEPAFAVLNEAVRIDSTAKEPYYILSQIHYDIAQDDSALFYVNKAIEIDSVLEYFTTRSQIYGTMQEYRKCIEDATYVLTQDSSSIESLYNRSHAYYKLGVLDSACIDYDKVYQLQPNSDLNKWVKCELNFE